MSDEREYLEAERATYDAYSRWVAVSRSPFEGERCDRIRLCRAVYYDFVRLALKRGDPASLDAVEQAHIRLIPMIRDARKLGVRWP